VAAYYERPAPVTDISFSPPEGVDLRELGLEYIKVRGTLDEEPLPHIGSNALWQLLGLRSRKLSNPHAAASNRQT